MSHNFIDNRPDVDSVPTASASAAERILIAEDSPTQAERLRHILRRVGYEVAVGQNGRLALEAAQTFRPALVISDVIMPEMNGYELCRRIKADPAHRGVPVILVTTLSDPEDVIRGLECGADNFLLKPYETDYLLSQVQYVLSNRAASAPPDDAGVEILFNGERHMITADRRQILNLLLSTYDAAIERTKELQRSHEQLRFLNEKLKETNQSLEAFAYSASHDLRAPLRHISGYGAILEEEAGAVLSEKARRCLHEMTSASRRMAQLISDLLEYARSERAEMREVAVDLDALVRESLSELEMTTRGRNITWKIAPLPRVTGDAAMLKQVFANLIGNAVKYTAPRDPAVIEIGTSSADEREAVLFVRDNGVGFDPRFAGKLFEAFQRLHGSDEFEGTGIGLATVRRVVGRHGGRVWAEGMPDEGATFYLALRAAPH